MKFLLVGVVPMVRAALTGLIHQRFADARVIGMDTAAAARADIAADPPSLVLLDLRVEGGLGLLEQLHGQQLRLPVVVISGGDNPEDAMRAIGAGAMGYVPERSDLDALVQALHLVRVGGTYFPPVSQNGRPAPALPVPATGEPSDAELAALPLTPRQKAVLKLLAQGLPNKLIARELGVSVETVKDHVAAVLKALGVASRTQAALVVGQKNRL